MAVRPVLALPDPFLQRPSAPVGPIDAAARALLHELDHLDGFLFLDRVASPHSVYRRKVYR